MKKIYIIIIFLTFFNVFSFMTAWFGIFPTEYESGSAMYDVNTTDVTNTPGESIFEDITEGHDFTNILSIFFGDFGSLTGFATTLAILGVALIIAKWTHNIAPLVVAFLGIVVKNMYVHSMDIFEQFPINNYLMIGFGLGMILLFVITSAEYLTHGDV